MADHQSLGRQFTRRWLITLALLAILTTVFATVGYYVSERHAAASHLAGARENYISVIANLERRWGREAYNLKMRLESQHILESTVQRREKVLSYLIAQGSSIEFPSLHIEDARGELIAAFEYVGHKIPKVCFTPYQESIWVFSQDDGRLYLVFRQHIWLGSENGHLLLFKPMDHALLTQYGYPNTQLSLWWKGKPVASSNGEDGMAAAPATLDNGSTNPKQVILPWPGHDNANAPQLLIESTYLPPLSPGQLIPSLSGCFLILLLVAWSILGNWGKRTLDRIAALNRAQAHFHEQQILDQAVEQDLRFAHGESHDEITVLAEALEQTIRESAKNGAVRS